MSKKQNQKPSPEVEVSKIEAAAPAEDTASQEQQEPASGETPPAESGDARDEGAAEPEQAKDAETLAAPVVITTVAETSAEPAAAPEHREPLTIHLSKAVKDLLTGGKPEAVHALHKLEMGVGDLKNALPAAIEATADEALKADLTNLLAVL